MNKAYDIIKKSEGCKLKAYLCPARIPTIGWGNTMYENGAKVKLGDEITQQKADEMLVYTCKHFEKEIKKLLKVELNENQLGALLSFTYNLGVGNLRISTLLRKINTNPADPAIKEEFPKWNKANGKILSGLTKRREEEAALYFS